MNKIIKKLQSSDKEIEDVFFNRPVSNKFASSIGLVISNTVAISEVNKVYSALISLGHYPIIVADKKVSKYNIPIDVALVSKDKIRYQNADEAIGTLSNCKQIIILAGRELNAAMELLVSKFFQDFMGVVITDYPKLFEKSAFQGDKMILTNDLLIKEKKDIGLNHLYNSLLEYSKKTSSAIIYYGTKQILGVDRLIEDKACIINCTDKVDINYFVGILAGLLIDRAEPLDQGWLKYCQAAGYLYRIYQKEGPSGVTNFLNNKF